MSSDMLLFEPLRESIATTTPVPRLQNIVSTFSMGISFLDLHNIVLKMPFMEFNARRFAAGILRLRDPKTTCLIFASGKGVCTGAKTESQSQLAAVKFVTLLQRAGIKVYLQNFKVQNIVSAAHCPFTLNLKHIAETVSGMCSYEPNLFPGLMYRVQALSRDKESKNTIVFLCFASGRCVITGGKNRGQILSAWNSFYNDILCKYRSGNEIYGAGVSAKIKRVRRLHLSGATAISDSTPLQNIDCEGFTDWDMQTLMHTKATKRKRRNNNEGDGEQDGSSDCQSDGSNTDAEDESTFTNQLFNNQMQKARQIVNTVKGFNSFETPVSGIEFSTK